jgi:hypothetical protein
MPNEIISDKLDKKEYMRTFRFLIDGAPSLVVEVYTDGTDKLDVDEIMRNGPSEGTVSLREVTVGDLKGIENRSKGPQGEVVQRLFGTPDKTRRFGLSVYKDVNAGVPEDQVKAFLESFKPLK